MTANVSLAGILVIVVLLVGCYGPESISPTPSNPTPTKSLIPVAAGATETPVSTPTEMFTLTPIDIATTIPSLPSVPVTAGWVRQFGTAANDVAESVAVDGEGNVYMVGWTDGLLVDEAFAGGRDAFLRKYDNGGNELWTRQFGSTRIDIAYDVALDEDGTVYVAGSTSGSLSSGSSSGGVDAFLRKYDSDGEEIWTRQFGSVEAYTAIAYTVAIDMNRNVYVAGLTNGSLPGQVGTGDEDTFLRKYDQAGKELWTRQSAKPELDLANDLVVDREGNVYLTGFTLSAVPGESGVESGNGFLAKYDSRGNALWNNQLAAGGVHAMTTTVDRSGALYVAGGMLVCPSGDTGGQSSDFFLRKYDDEGEELWALQSRILEFDSAYGVAVDGEGNIFLAGSVGSLIASSGLGGESTDAFLVKYDSEGERIWIHRFGSDKNELVTSLAVEDSGGVYIAGGTFGALPGQTHAGDLDAFLVKLVQ